MGQGFEELIKAHDLSVTSARLAILGAIERFPHADAETIWKHAKRKIGSLSKQSVYDNLHALTERGILRMIQPMGHSARYEARVDDNHHHLVCRSCGHTVDVDCAKGKRPCIDPKQTHGFAIDEAEVIYWGICPNCQ